MIKIAGNITFVAMDISSAKQEKIIHAFLPLNEFVNISNIARKRRLIKNREN